jgi:tetratricopeptide (TPR) repeat protein
VDALTFEADILRYRFASRRDPADLERASALLRQARELAPEDPRPLAVSFEVAFQAEQLKEAEKALRELERLQPADTRVLTQRARLLEYRHDPERALDLMREAVRRLPSWNNLFRLAAMENRQGQREAAHRHLKELLKRFPGFYAAESLLAEVELTSGNAARAAEIYTALVRRSPQTGELANLGVANLLLRRYPEAEAQLKQALAAEPGNPFVELNLADVLLLQGREGESRAVYRQLLDRIERDPAASQWQFQTARAQALAHLGRFREAVEAVQPVLAAARDNAQAAFEVSLVYALVGDRVSALLYRERALALGFGPPWFGLPWFSSLRS